MKKIIRKVILIVCICVMGYCLYNIINYVIEENVSRDLNDDLISRAITTVDVKAEDTNNDNSNPTVENKMKVDFEVLKSRNKDIIGWIYLENTIINYPVVQSNDNEYYLRRLIDGSYNRAGTIFMDYRNNKDLSDWKTIIYGHNMNNNTMFGTLLEYKKQDYYNEHKTIKYFTDEKELEIVLFAGYLEDASSEIYNYSKNEIDKDSITKNAIRNSTFKSDVEVTANDKIVILSTCSYEYDDARYVLMGIVK